ncbi:hypothetical protein JG687_00003734 [Phytophthora cactorum]|uniref:Uncharacterized protein n=1 Tax=Phytophthora cactorum TaxID=29920 RepID=A0A8T1UR68_9STRA|nr:hypothetical protein JG687_00003734 [Phytophthora cactorum]
MKQTAPASREATKSKRLIPWDSDNSEPNGLTSMRVLLHWIRVSGNYASWHKGGKDRVGAVKTIYAALARHRITHRSVGAIDTKIKAIVKQFVAALKLLTEEGLLSDYLDQEDSDGRVERRVLKRCPYYRLLAPVLSKFSFHGKTPKDWTTCDDSEDSDYVEQEASTAVTKRKRKGESDERRPIKQRTLDAIADLNEHDQTEEGPNSQSCAGQSCDPDAAACTEIVTIPRQDEQEEEVDGQECELQIERYRVAAEKHRFEMEERRREMTMRADTMLTRQVLKSRRVAKEEIDQVLPIPKV